MKTLDMRATAATLMTTNQTIQILMEILISNQITRQIWLRNMQHSERSQNVSAIRFKITRANLT